MKGDCSEQDWRDVQQRLIAYFDGDEKIKNPSRLMRLPYFNHVSYDAQDQIYSFKLVSVVEFDRDLRYSVAQMRQAFPPASESDAAGNDIARTSTPDLSTWDALNAEARRRVRKLKPTLSGDGDWLHAKGICHTGEGNKALFVNLDTDAFGCMAGCDTTTILRSLGLPDQPQAPTGTQEYLGLRWTDVDYVTYF